MRPRTLDEFAGQDHLIGPGRLLRRAIQADQLSSVILHGPPGTGKTTLARIVANTTSAHFVALNAVLAGVADLRKAVAEAERRRAELFQQRTILFVDEVHRFNKAQQDALLPWVENGVVVLIGATTENPFFEVNKALVSRSRVFQLQPLTDADLVRVAQMALADRERGYGALDVALDDDALDHLVNVANGDARALLNALELAVETTEPDDAGRIRVDLTVAEESIQRRAVLYDKEGDAHYDTVSAFIKSVRGSDPDAALYWLARMVYAGEDPRFILRRLLILASEDIGLADPHAIEVVVACARAFDYVGLPEGQFHLTHAVLYLATAPKSNTALGYFDALAAVRDERSGDIPASLKDDSRDGAALGHGQGYLYPHAYRDHWVAQQYLPDGLRGRVFYRPSDQGAEAELGAGVARRREAQLAAMLEGDDSGGALSWTGPRVAGEGIRERWLARATGRAGARLAAVRDRVLDAAAIARHHRVLDLHAGTGLLAWEAARRAPEGGVWALVADGQAASALTGLAAELGGPAPPTVLVGAPEAAGTALEAHGDGDVRFEAIVGRDALGHLDDGALGEALGVIVGLLAPGGRLVLAESPPAAGSRPSDLVPADTLPEGTWPAWRDAEDAFLAAEPRGALVAGRLADALAAAGLGDVSAETLVQDDALAVNPAMVARWFEDGAYASALAGALDPAAVAVARARVAALVGTAPVPWRMASILVVGRSRE